MTTTALTSSNDEQTNCSTAGEVSDKVKAVMTAILQQWPAAQIDDRDPAGVWSNAINDLTAEQVRYAIRQLKHEVREYALNPGQFRAIARQHQPYEQEVIKPIADLSERQEALKATKTLYGLRICQVVLQKPTSYEGGFDFESVAQHVALPPEGCSIAETRPYWERLEREFERAWSEYVT